jgi:hypothetical protein
MLYLKRTYLIFSILVITALQLIGQDTTIYIGLLGNKILYETIELYPDSTFKWTSEYDLTWSEYGIYEIDSNKLELKYFLEFDYPKSMSLKDSIQLIKDPRKTITYSYENGSLFRFNETGKRVRRIQDKSVKTSWSWITRHRHKYKILME